ncbi:MAG: peptidoglycan-binding protein [Clostridia bacterium]|nr:peptidoglycan-binding protein [Clostridia bacterium]
MFCSKCGKTIRPDDQICPSCQAPIGDNRFGGIPYTSAQFTIAPGQTSFEPLNGYTRTTYTSMDDAAQEGGAPDSRTTYRPVYEGGSMPENVRRDVRAAMSPEPEAEPEPDQPERPADERAFAGGEPIFRATQDTLEAIDEELQPDEAIDLSQFRSRPIQSAGRAGISRDVSEYIRKLEDDQSRRGGRHRRGAAPVYDDYQERPEDRAGEPESDYAGDDNENRPYDGYADDPQDGVFDDIDDQDYEDYRRAGRFGVSQIVKILIALVVVAAVVFGAIKWIGYIRGSQSSAPIEGVTESFYEQGVALIKSHVQSDYINARIGQYTSDGTLAMVNALTQDQAEIDALMPAEPAANDATFLSALSTIQESIYSAITMDAMSVGDANAVSKSEANWQIISNAITQLESAKSAAELTAIISGQKVTVQSSTPEPTQTPVAYTILQKGDKSDDVLKLQERLYQLGYLNSDRDGAFGGKTQTAVKAFQERAGLEASGIADSNTQTLLFSDSAPYAAGVASPTPSAASTPEPEVIQSVENIQANPVSDGAAATDAPVQDVPAQ